MIDRFKAACARAWAWCTYKWRQFTALVLSILAAFGLAVIAQDNSVTLSWDNATTYENGDPLPIEEIQETRIYRASYPVGQADGSLAKTRIDSVTPDVTVYVDSPGNGTHCYHLTHVATNGGESAPSAEVCKTIDQRRPGSPQNVRAE